MIAFKYKWRKNAVFRRDTFPGTWFDVQPGGCYDKQNLDNATCASSMGCAKSQDWLPTDVAVYANTVVSSHLYTPFYQDRLGTNIAKTQKRLPFFQVAQEEDTPRPYRRSH